MSKFAQNCGFWPLEADTMNTVEIYSLISYFLCSICFSRQQNVGKCYLSTFWFQCQMNVHRESKRVPPNYGYSFVNS